MKDCIKIYSDGGARGNPGPAASAFLVYDHGGKLLHEESHFLGSSTNNVAEYSAVLAAVEYLASQKLSPPCVQFFLDSELVVRQLSGIYKIKNETLKGIAEKIQEKLSSFHFSFHHVPRAENASADKLVNICLDENVKR